MHRTDAPSRAEARKYLQSRYQMIYEGCAWRDVCAMMVVPFDAAQVVIFPAIVDRIIGIRWSNNYSLRNESLWTIMEIDPNRFDQVGDPISYSIISPSALATTPGGSALHLSTTSTTATFPVSIYGSHQNQEVNETVQVPNVGFVQSANQYDEVYSLSKSTTGIDLSVGRADSGAQVLYLRPYERERKHQRVHFHSVPRNSSPNALLMFKRTFKPLISDSDAPEISGIDNALLSAAISDMLEGQRQYGKAQAKMQEAVAMIAVMSDMERHQSASVIRIIPNPEPDFLIDPTWTSKDHFVP